ncbi:acyltransferase [Treponema phagedenis]|uniref:acyltransferase family protein n=1 Tax=Treponema phagedenis TaxID=162 RepID=UPI00197D3D9C|nr:acyltransferase [Treponema phagedenis]
MIFIKRCRKIFPLYYATIFIIALIFVFFTSLRPLEYFTSFHFYKYLFANGIFLNFICPNLPGVFNGLPVNGSLWTLKVEIGFYLILPIILYVYTKISSTLKKQVFLILVYLSSFAYIFIVKKTPNIPAQFVHQLPAYMAYFVSGISYILNWDFLCKKEFKLITYSLLVIILYFFTSSTFVEIFLPFALTIFVVFFARHLKVFNSVGAKIDYSYSMYLFHYPIIMTLNEIDYFKQNPVIAVIAVFSITFSLSFMIQSVKNLILLNLRGIKK